MSPSQRLNTNWPAKSIQKYSAPLHEPHSKIQSCFKVNYLIYSRLNFHAINFPLKNLCRLWIIPIDWINCKIAPSSWCQLASHKSLKHTRTRITFVNESNREKKAILLFHQVFTVLSSYLVNFYWIFVEFCWFLLWKMFVIKEISKKWGNGTTILSKTWKKLRACIVFVFAFCLLTKFCQLISKKT